MYRLYSIPGSCSTGIHVLLNRLNQEVEIVPRDAVANYQDIVPTNQVPALQVGDELLTEGAAIVMHLLEQHDALPQAGAPLREFRQWLMFNYATLHPTYSRLFLAGVANVIEHPASRSTLIEHTAARLSELWQIVEQRLQNRKYMTGDDATVIDYLLAVYANWGNAVPEANISIGPRTRQLITNVLALPEFARAVQRENIEVRLPQPEHSAS
ncbi:MAG: glutathione S-transferase family protein [Pseudomonadota bacterium]